MAELEKDVVAGIGNKPTGDNIITPAFDATFRHFVAGKDCILNGLELSANSLTLTAGSCLGMGFQGELKTDITFESAPQKIYGRFVINHDSNELDHFYIETDPTGKISQPDILKERGEYWLLLYENGVRMVDNNYPENAVNSDTSIRLIEGGTIAESAEVEGDIPQSPLTYDKRVASTGFVNEAIKEQILGLELTEFDVSNVDEHITSLKYSIVGFGNFVLLHININSTSNTGYVDKTLFTVEDRYRPITQQTLLVSSNYDISLENLTPKNYHITPEGNVVMTDTFRTSAHEYYFFYRRDI